MNKFSTLLVLVMLVQGQVAWAFQPQRSASTTATKLALSNAVGVSGGTNTMTVDIRENVQRDVLAMEEWAARCGVQRADGLQLVANDSYGRDWSVMTQQPLQQGSPVLFVPNQMLLSSWSAAQEYGPALEQAEQELLQANMGYQIPLFRVFTKILVEFERGTESPYFLWLNSLPRLFNNGAAMTYACFECLPPYVAWLSMKERRNCVNFRKAAEFLHSSGILSEPTATNTNILKWAYCVAVTRSIEVQGERVIIPMADMFNHGTETEVSIQFDEQGNSVAYATRDIPPGSPLRISYRDPTNPSPLFATYGFLDKSSPASFCKMMHLASEMEQLGMNFSQLLFYKDTGAISPQVWDLVLFSVLAQDPNRQQQFYQAIMSGDHQTKQQFHQQFFSYSLEAMKKHVDGTLREIDELSREAMMKDPNTHPRVPAILNHNDFVKETFLRVKANLDSMM